MAGYQNSQPQSSIKAGHLSTDYAIVLY